MGSVFTDYHYAGSSQMLKSGCNPFSNGIASKVSSFQLIGSADCSFYQGSDCRTGFLWEANARSDETVRNYNDMAQSASCK